MKSTMQTTPLLISSMLSYGSTVHANAKVITWTGEGSRTTTFAEVGTKSAQLAHALRGLGITGDQLVFSRGPGRDHSMVSAPAPRLSQATTGSSPSAASIRATAGRA